MDLTPYISALNEDLTAAASAGDEQTQRIAAALSAAVEPSMRLALMNALSDLAAEVTSQLDEHVVDVRLHGKDVRVVVSSSADTASGSGTAGHEAPAEEESRKQRGETGDMSRMTLRLFEELKSRAEDAAASQGISLNTYVSRAVQHALQGKWEHAIGGQWKEPRARSRPGETHPTEPAGQRLRGWVQG